MPDPPENLLRDAVALVQRAEISVPSHSATIVVGFRRGGAFSVYFGGDPVYQFNDAGQLRRAFVDGVLYKADAGRLVTLMRVRDGNATTLHSHVLIEDEQASILSAICTRLRNLADSLAGGRFALIGQWPPDATVVEKAQHFLNALPADCNVALRPHVSQ